MAARTKVAERDCGGAAQRRVLARAEFPSIVDIALKADRLRGLRTTTVNRLALLFSDEGSSNVHAKFISHTAIQLVDSTWFRKFSTQAQAETHSKEHFHPT